jgi:hypothetical protein
MYPLHDDHINLGDITKYWSRDLTQRPPEEELLALLIKAYWKGELQIRKLNDLKPLEAIDFIKIIESQERQRKNDADILIGTSTDELPLEQIAHTDGSASIDLRPRLILPEDQSWSDKIVNRAIKTLSQVDWKDYPTAVRSGIFLCMIAKDDFAEFCDTRNFDRPKFWFKQMANPAQKSSSLARVKVRKWLKEQARKPKNKSKKAYFEEADALFEGLSKRSFDLAWSEVVPESWRKSGAPRKGARRND